MSSTLGIGDRVQLVEAIRRRLGETRAARGTVVALDGRQAMVAWGSTGRAVDVHDLIDLEPAQEGGRATAHPTYDQLVEYLIDLVGRLSRDGTRCTTQMLGDWIVEAFGSNAWIADHAVRLAIARGVLSMAGEYVVLGPDRRRPLGRT